MTRADFPKRTEFATLLAREPQKALAVESLAAALTEVRRTFLVDQEVKRSPNMGRPLFDSSFVASS
jgi:hypothetical protein